VSAARAAAPVPTPFNGISDTGCAVLAARTVVRNPFLSTLYLSGNAVAAPGALALARLCLTAKRLGPAG
jgi:hypothetical protein